MTPTMTPHSPSATQPLFLPELTGNIDKDYLAVALDILANGTRKENRTGVDTLSLFSRTLRYTFTSSDDGASYSFPLLTTKKVPFLSVVLELLWFLSGSDNQDFLERHGVTFWRPWYNADGTVKNCYGPAWRSFPTHREVEFRALADAVTGVYNTGDTMPVTVGAVNDQIAWVLEELKRNPMSRRLVVSAWAPGVAQSAPLPPCHLMFIFNVTPGKEKGSTPKLNLQLIQRSADWALGVPFNIASYALLLLLFARFTGMVPGEVSYLFVDAHVYTAKEDGSQRDFDHTEGLLFQCDRWVTDPRPLPTLTLSDKIRDLSDLTVLLRPSVTKEDIRSLFTLEGYNPHPAIPYKPAVLPLPQPTYLGHTHAHVTPYQYPSSLGACCPRD